ncbi:leucine/isoleucine/valine transporter permease subunit [Caballeronia fortuita]|uniref:Leucine/isoleucine/valine transporter permease subunit n=1 Tax=Caballeronia fortuita TaxID=1777138 RepID=A0A158CBB5_9BURK|nr:branched-chain amino acid ABC transporter permease [Caballeronia fortuita]SAK79599.1 leucine/isoleucine/valine transporter permease subunit [Caballeronia fortuita]
MSDKEIPLRRAEISERRPSASKLSIAIAKWSVAVLITLALALLPYYASFGTLRLSVEILTVFAVALAWNLLAGYGGLVAVGQHAFIGLGAYTLFAVSNQFGVNPWVTLPIAGLASAAFALLSAWPMFRLSGPNFAVGTWVLAEVLRIGAQNCDWLGGSGGLPLMAMREFSRETRNFGAYWAALAIGIGSLWGARHILRGKLGLGLMSVRDSAAAAQASGVPIYRVKLLLWVIAGTITGLAGAVAYMSTLQVTPDASFGLQWTAEAIFITILGGLGTLEGPIIGTVIYFALREATAGYGTWYFVGLGTLAIVTMLIAPGGAWSLIARRWSLDLFSVRRRAD